MSDDALSQDPTLLSSTIVEKRSRGKKYLVSVGDRTTERFLESGCSPSLEIVDGFERRVARERPKFKGREEHVITAQNPAGTISASSLAAISHALKLLLQSEDKDASVRIEIQGEEDLLVLPILAFFPEGTVVAYGQPGEGMVLVAAENRQRKEAMSILAEIGIANLTPVNE